MSSPQVKRVDPKEAEAAFLQESASAGADAPAAIGNVADAVVSFIKVEDYTTFVAEYAFIDGNIVLHFFHSRETWNRDDKWHVTYFLDMFPSVLSQVAEAYFEATKPRIVAQYTPEMTSWYMRANGFAVRLDPDGFVRRFLSKLDVALDEVLAARGTSL